MEKIKYYIEKYKVIIVLSNLIVLLSTSILYTFVYSSKEKRVVEPLEVNEEKNIEKEENEPQKIKVDIKGFVKEPGVYEMNVNDRVIDVIRKAGGLIEQANTEYINLSKILTDEMIIIIYSNDELEKFKETDKEVIYIEYECVCPDNKNDACISKEDTVNTNGIKEKDEVSKESSKENEDSLVSINTGTLEELMTLSGIGESKAKSIIKYREEKGSFEKIEDIMNVSGIGEAAYSKIKDNIKESYSLEGSLSMTNNDDVYNYDVSVSYKKDDYYKVSLTNVSNNHTQVILKNNDGVYIVTPSLNKSFKFQSDWPYDNSQIYLLEALINDIESDSDYKFVYEDDKFIFKTKVNYPNNKMLNHQKIVFDNDMDLEKVLVFDSNDVVRMELVIKDIEYSPTFKNNYFDLNNLIKTFDEVEVVESSKIDDSIFPLFVPSGTKLQNSEIIETDVGERLIMTFDGDKPFLLVGETADVMDEFTIIPTYGEPYM